MKKLLSILIITLIGFGFKSNSPKITIFLIGDSTMANKSTNVFPETGWGQVLSAYADTSKLNIQNHAKNGRSTKSFREEGLWAKVVSLIKPGDYVFIQFGHNDEKQHKPSVYAKADTDFKKNLELYIRETRDKKGIPVLLTSIVRRDFDTNGKLNATHGNYPTVVKRVALEQQVTIIDMEQKTRLLIESYGVDASKSLYLHINPGDYNHFTNGKLDNTHLSRGGAIRVAGLVVEYIKNNMAELRPYF